MDEITYSKILKCTNKAQIRNLGGYLDKAKYKQFQKQNSSKCYMHIMMKFTNVTRRGSSAGNPKK